MPKINKTKFAILGVLSKNPASGYDIKKYCDASIVHFWNENYGHIYPVLKQMEKDELIVKKTEYVEGKPPRNIFSITEKGKKELNEWLLIPAEYPPRRNEFLLKLVFSKDVPSKILINKVEVEKSKIEKSLIEYKNVEKTLIDDERLQSSKNMQLWLIAVRYGIMDIKSKLEWCNETLIRLQNLPD